MPTIVITGASQGIGAAIAHAFADEPDAKLALVARSESKLRSVAEACRANGAEARAFVCDVTDETAVARMAAGVGEAWGAPDLLVNNAGLFRPGALVETELATFKEMIDANLTSAFIVTRAFVGDMVSAKRGLIVFMASVAAIRPYAGGAAYCAAKHGMLGLARVVREETRAAGVRVTCLMPGATYTPSWDQSDIPEERFMPSTDIARSVLDLYRLSDRTVVEEVVLRPQLGDL